MTHLYAPTDPEPETQIRCVCGKVHYDENFQNCVDCGAEL